MIGPTRVVRVDHAAYLDQIRVQCAALRAAAVAAGPDAPVPTCPQWRVRDLVTHVATLQAWGALALALPPEGPAAPRPEPPADWEALLAWWDERAEESAARFAETDPATRIWSFLPGLAPDAAWFARRQAHEAAVHRLDAEHAAKADVPSLLFDTDFAADGVDELLDLIAQFGQTSATGEGTLLLHAADAGRAWLITLVPGAPMVVDTQPHEPTALDADSKVVGTADAVYRAVWGRPSHAVVSGDPGLVSTLKSF